MTNTLSLTDVLEARNRISKYIEKTKIISDEGINKRLHNKIFFKLDNLQKTGSFKIRGAFNHLLSLQEKGILPKKVVAVTSGNHGKALAYICKELKIEALIYTPKITPKSKIDAIESLGAKVVITEKRAEANKLSEEKIKEGYHYIHPSADNLVIAGQGSIFLESLEEIEKIDTVFVPCGGGGLVSGIYLASQQCENKPKIFAVEPEVANDAYISVENNKIFAFTESPKTIADGARTLAISENTFQYLKKIDGIITVGEDKIISWTKELNIILEGIIEPTSAMSMAGCEKWINENNIKNQNILIIISGGNSEMQW